MIADIYTSLKKTTPLMICKINKQNLSLFRGFTSNERKATLYSLHLVQFLISRGLPRLYKTQLQMHSLYM